VVQREGDIEARGSGHGQVVARERFVVAVLYALVIVIAFPNVIFSRRSLMPSDNLNPFDYRLLPQNYGPRLLPAEEFRDRGLLLYPGFHDIGASLWQAEPGLVFLRDTLRAGELPFWDPYSGSGTPAVANLTCAFLFPPEVLLALAGATSLLKNLYVLLLFWTAAFATFIVLRQHRIHVLAAFAGGLVFMFSGALQQAGSLLFKGQAIALMPVVLMMTRWFADRPTWRRVAALSFVFAVVAQASFPPVLVFGFGLATAYIIAIVVMRVDPPRQTIAKRFAIAAALAIGMSAFIFLPAVIAVRQASQARQFYSDAAQVTLYPAAYLQLLGPTALGGRTVYEHPAMRLDEYHQLFHVGAIALLLAVIGMACGRHASGPLWLASLVATVFVVDKVFGVPPAQWIAYIPGLSTVHFALYAGFILDLLLALLAAMGIDRLVRATVNRRVLLSMLIFIELSLVFLWGNSRVEQIFLQPDHWRWEADFTVIAIFAAIGAALILVAAETSRLKFAAAVALTLAVAVEGITNCSFPRQSRFDVFAHVPTYVRAMQNLPAEGRFFTTRVLDPNLGSSTGIREVDSIYNFHTDRMFDLYTTYCSPTTGRVFHFLRDATELPPDAVLDRMNVAYVALRPAAPSSHDIEVAAQQRGYAILFGDEYARIYRRPTKPRAFFSSAYAVTDRASAVRMVSALPSDRIVLETPPPFTATPNSGSDPQPVITHASRNHLTVDVNAPRQGLLYIADSWFPGWTAKVNGKRKPILNANLAYRAVVVPAGRSTVRFDYFPAGMLAGLVIAAISAAAALSLCRPGLE
jgi:hypothetical protein